MGKMFTAVAVLQLVEAGKIDLKAPVKTYLADYPNQELATQVTIHHLLTHTGGTGDIFGPQFDRHRTELRDLKDYPDLYGAQGTQFEPGSRFAYSNYGFVLLGLIVEKVSGQSYYDYVREHIFKPAGMTATDSLPETTNVPGRSFGYMRTPDGNAWRSNVDTLLVRGTPAGGIYSTAGDLLRFALALRSNELLAAKSVELLTTGKVSMEGKADAAFQYAYGFMDTVQYGARWFGHSGAAAGMNGEFWMAPDKGYVIVVLANLDPPAATSVAREIASRLPPD